MIHVTIKRLAKDNSHITSYVVEGHAYYDDPGKDIVCSAVSAVAVGTVNSIEALTGIIPIHEMETGFLDITIPEIASSNQDKVNQVQLILESMVVMLRSIEETYGAYITIETLIE
ncbi:ribosomal-processing cysteine protease Prp [Paenibacillus hexagrammi]|uniref:Ribosomal processing cysteine protease Prp n=1 Tax=Paenibacillus hexagrammi TaxID=2908839 RepID=A0ABY3SEZ5_9BACL|nr:ribosomal-processing cysteine protease Prp [Paenibacillus sp. YPD9-1]UJF31993.1 ribosomal-processing cysteine protease Prp [Paenibacillus sp. YPD9-1]